jgi:hypothetical protein
MAQILAVFVILALLAFPAPVHAYLDPGTGSFIFQIAIASGLGIIFAFKNFGTKIKDLFAKKSKSVSPHNEQTKNQKRK